MNFSDLKKVISVFFWIGIKLSRVISTGRLSTLPHLHSRPIDVVVYHDP